MPEIVTNGTAAEPEKASQRQGTPAPSGDHHAETEPNPPVIDAYLAATEQAALADDSPEAIERRLTRLKTAIDRRAQWHDDDWTVLIDGLTRYSYQVVRSWLAIIAMGAGDRMEAETDRSRLVGADVDELAESVVSRAENGFRNELSRIRWWLDGTQPDMKALHLMECVIQLPGAYRDWQLRHHDTSAEDSLEDLATGHHDAGSSAWPLQRVHQSLTMDRERVLHMLQRTLRYTEPESREIIEATLSAFEVLARRGGSR